ncbi:MAG: VF530 family DNA-binding protein [Pseudomonadota bacterium]
MNNEINYKNNPLHGVSLKNLLIEIVDHYGFEILFAYLNINCFRTNPSIASSVKFLKKTDWAREKVETFYLYEFKNLPRASSEQFLLPPRDRIVPEDQTPGEPTELSLEDAERLREKRAKKSAVHGQRSSSGKSLGAQRGRHSYSRDNNRTRKGEHESLNSPDSSIEGDVDPWAKWKNKHEH